MRYCLTTHDSITHLAPAHPLHSLNPHRPSEDQVLAMLIGFGDELVEMACSSWLWRIQADALSKTKYAGGGKGNDMKELWRKSESSLYIS